MITNGRACTQLPPQNLHGKECDAPAMRCLFSKRTTPSSPATRRTVAAGPATLNEARASGVVVSPCHGYPPVVDVLASESSIATDAYETGEVRDGVEVGNEWVWLGLGKFVGGGGRRLRVR
jgi:hypothetical protein